MSWRFLRIATLSIVFAGCGAGDPSVPQETDTTTEPPSTTGTSSTDTSSTDTSSTSQTDTPTDPPVTGTPSQLWGKGGELWSSTGPLFDYSYAGYHTGVDPLPDAPVTANVKDFGAVGDGSHDDTQAFLDAIQSTDSGAILVPKGTYVLTQRLQIKKSHIVLRGEGPDQTTLYMPKSLGDIYGLTFNSANQSNWSFSGGFIEVLGSDSGAKLAGVAAPAKRGSTSVEVSSASSIKVGQWIRIVQTDVSKTLINRLHADLMTGGDDCVGDKAMDFHTRVTAVNGTTITLERPLPEDVEDQWSPAVYDFAPKVEEVGVEHLTMRFLGTTYPGHFQEHGYNAIYYSHVSNSWVRDVRVVNGDYGVNLSDGVFCTATGVELDTDFDRGPLVGHHGISDGHGGDCLITDFDIKKTFVHDLTVEWYVTGTVFAGGKGVDLNMDHHRAAPYGTLFTDIDLGKGKRAFASGGSGNRGPHSAAYSMLWNVRAAAPFALPSADFGPRLSFVGIDTSDADLPSGNKEWFLEKIPSSDIYPQDIHQAMLDKRMGKK